MSDDLVKRLREKAKNKRNSVGDKWGDWVCDEAADRIEVLEAERDVLRKGIFDALGRYQVTHIHAALRNTVSNIERRF